MGLGVLDDRRLDNVPGTVQVLDHGSAPHRGPGTSGLKYDHTGSTPVVLVPQPSDDPNDPLNWPLWKRDLIVVLLSIASVMAVALSPILAANTLTLALFFRRDFTAIALLTGYHLLGVGVSGFLFVPFARVWGKRHLYLFGIALLILSSAWAGASRSYNSLLWARIVQGVAVAPFEALINATVGDLYFVHQRGIRMALSNLALFGSAFFTPIIVGKVTYTIGWPWTFYMVAIFSGAILPFVIFFAPETTYSRASHLNTDVGAADIVDQHDSQAGHPHGDGIALNHAAAGQTASDQRQNSSSEGLTVQANGDGARLPMEDGFLKRALPFSGRKTDENFVKLLLRPLPLYLHPAVAWACLIQGTLVGWTVFIGVVLAAIFLGPPLFFNEEETGYLYAGAFIGALLGFVVSGLLADWSARIMTGRNRGIYEPEFRIVLVIPQLIFGCAGIYGFGITSNNVDRYGWFWPDFFFGLEVMGMVIGAVGAALYIVDAHRDISVEAFTALMIFKNMFSFALTWGAYDWIVELGIVKTFNIIGSIQVAVCLLCVPMYVLGKKNRSFFYRHDLLTLTGLR